MNTLYTLTCVQDFLVELLTIIIAYMHGYTLLLTNEFTQLYITIDY